MSGFIDRVGGIARLRITGVRPESVLNACALAGIELWGLNCVDECCIDVFTHESSLEDIRKICIRCMCGVSVLSIRGGSRWRKLARRRIWLIIAAAIIFLALVISSLFIWDFDVKGNEKLSSGEILRSLAECGVTEGSFWPGLPMDIIRSDIILKKPEIAWLTVNVKGCVAHVQVVERQRPPEIAEKDGVWNIVAARDGLVTRVQALDGKALVAEGSTVTEGELLVTGVYESREGNTYMTHSLGTVEARTWYELSVSVPLEITEKSGGRRKKTALSVDFGKKRIKLWGRGSISGASCDKITYYHPLSLPGGLRLPITMVRESVTYYDGQSVRRSREQAQKEGETLLLQQLKAQLGRDGSVTETRFSAAEEGDYLTVTLQAECLEQIGVPVQVQQTEEAN